MYKEYQCSLTFHKMFLILGLSDVSLSLDSGYAFTADACLHYLGLFSGNHTKSHSLVPTGDVNFDLPVKVLPISPLYEDHCFFFLKTSMQSIGRLQLCKSLLFMDVVSIDDSCLVPLLTRWLLQINAFPASALPPYLPIGPWLSTITVECICAANSIHLLL